ncbi:hypothetical protein [Carnobacterium maltaromaticum]|uniref:hypothetical protein n=1 Tax=Carnobacterium maltaromaticum TaxID=2751 RepID=UPI000E713F4C|nr:hypothetical protein [Carnobacterium maltaromaticum]AOA04149.1 hypothetical protein BFC23_16665 [Carnobacterium maltaromaticum]
MYDQKKILKFKKLGIVIVSIILLLAGFSVGFGMGAIKKKNTVEPVKKEVVEKKDDLTSDTVSKFLVAYYTKKDLGENRNRYEPLVTTAMFNELTAEENQPVNQAYKGYVVNQVLDSAEIYVNNEENTVICTVTYKNTQRVKQGTDDGALRNQSNQEAIKLTFLKQGKQYLVNKLEPITVSSANPLGNERNSYKSTSNANSTEKDFDSSIDSSEKTKVTEETKNESSTEQKN